MTLYYKLNIIWDVQTQMKEKNCQNLMITLRYSYKLILTNTSAQHPNFNDLKFIILNQRRLQVHMKQGKENQQVGTRKGEPAGVCYLYFSNVITSIKLLEPSCDSKHPTDHNQSTSGHSIKIPGR